ncbi:MAG: helix-turn-helix domain-containing protein [Deltaproteobacteria bacterium]|nr:helix-turn-helix domain-containing protein [Deltaproteobacteria bacterium]
MTKFQFHNLASFREQMMISRSEFARKAGLSPQTMNKLEAGGVCRPDTVKKVLSSLGIQMDGQTFVSEEINDEKLAFLSPFVGAGEKQLILNRVMEDETTPKLGRPAGKQPAKDRPKPVPGRKPGRPKK